MKQIALRGKNGKGKFAVVDDDVFEELNSYKWRLNSNGYVFRKGRPGERTRNVYLHRQVLNARRGDYIDHIHHNKLDNRAVELRLCTVSQNGFNQKLRSGKSSQFRGVSWDKKNKRWFCHLEVHGRQFNLGRYRDEHIAALMYDFWVLEVAGEFANTNFKVEKIGGVGCPPLGR